MKAFLKSCLVAGTTITGVIVIGGVYIVNEVANSLLLDQHLSERYGLLRCYQKLSTGELSNSSECGKYAQAHLPLYPEFNAKTPKESLCLVSKDILKILKVDYPSSVLMIREAEERVGRNCSPQESKEKNES